MPKAKHSKPLKRSYVSYTTPLKDKVSQAVMRKAALKERKISSLSVDLSATLRHYRTEYEAKNLSSADLQSLSEEEIYAMTRANTRANAQEKHSSGAIRAFRKACRDAVKSREQRT
ncbi:hypothetical protein CONPUDRAFT_137399 [Coniophora puteana RWD-64-598 SS2]|uniref:Uncharacterized protein n=1 Tax=Coniophora puteana (strain RWD-64-598) TaxID=741705 RepID=A0A5M3MQM5_CONPW|nr:uncharacterized protein CONPUDRAFT_137399 [Coniophora puteana RWD-64-598 SS2]EIW81473.1 hypothetical protein CONPUDRAFT_137399 [Coniophora puteana RWD-64-598 SS2]